MLLLGFALRLPREAAAATAGALAPNFFDLLGEKHRRIIRIVQDVASQGGILADQFYRRVLRSFGVTGVDEACRVEAQLQWTPVEAQEEIPAVKQHPIFAHTS